MKDFKDKIALVTGAGGGIGREIALELARKGCHVILNDITQPRLNEVGREIEQLGRRSHEIIADLSKRSEVERMCEEALAWLGRVDILVNNAGIATSGMINDIPLDKWEEIFNVNLWPHIISTRILLPKMKERGEGYFVHISSASGLWGQGFTPAYTTTKFAVVGFAESLAAQARSCGVGVSVVCPSFVKTDLMKSSIEAGHVYGDPGMKSRAPQLAQRFVRIGMSPRRVARKTVKAIQKNRFLVLTDVPTRVMYPLRSLFPQLFHRMNSWITEKIFL